VTGGTVPPTFVRRQSGSISTLPSAHQRPGILAGPPAAGVGAVETEAGVDIRVISVNVERTAGRNRYQ